MPRAPAAPRLSGAVVVVCILILSRSAEARYSAGRRTQPQNSDRVIVRVGAPDAAAAGNALAAASGLAFSNDLGDGFVVLEAKNDPPRASAATAAMLAAAGKAHAGTPPTTPLEEAVAAAQVSSVEEDFIVQSLAMPSECPYGNCTGLWGMNAIRAPQAWALVEASDNLLPTLVSVRGSVVDTGVMYTHAELNAPQLLESLGRSYRLGPVSGRGADDQGHGTHVTGTMAAEWGGSAGSIAGVVGKAGNIVSCKFLWSNGGYTSDAVACLNYIMSADVKAHAVINNSWGGGGYSAALFDAIAKVCAAGGLFLAAAGNDGVDIAAGAGAFPANYAAYKGAECVIPVAAVSSTLKLASFSNFGATVPIAAPGVSIRSSVWARKSTKSEATWSGTSMATPHVSGVALLLLNQFPKLNGTQVKDILIQSASKVVQPYGSKTIGGGLLNAEAAMTTARDKAKTL